MEFVETSVHMQGDDGSYDGCLDFSDNWTSNLIID